VHETEQDKQDEHFGNLVEGETQSINTCSLATHLVDIVVDKLHGKHLGDGDDPKDKGSTDNDQIVNVPERHEKVARSKSEQTQHDLQQVEHHKAQADDILS